MKPISVLIAEDHTMVREGFCIMLKQMPDIQVIGEAQDGRTAIALALELKPDVILMDIAMPELNGLEATRQLIHADPSMRIIILTAHCDDAYVKSAIDSGASGFVLKQDSSRDVYRAIREVSQGRNFYSRVVSKRLLRSRSQSLDRIGIIRKNSARLTSREEEVLQLVAEGKANKQMAASLGISIKTIEKHRANLMNKLDIHDTAGLTRYAIAVGAIESSVQITII